MMLTTRDKTNKVGPGREIDILWITAGLGCDSDTIAMTAATQPTLEEVLLGGSMVKEEPRGTLPCKLELAARA